jgi:hypothetical protein
MSERDEQKTACGHHNLLFDFVAGKVRCRDCWTNLTVPPPEPPILRRIK